MCCTVRSTDLQLTTTNDRGQFSLSSSKTQSSYPLALTMAAVKQRKSQNSYTHCDNKIQQTTIQRVTTRDAMVNDDPKCAATYNVYAWRQRRWLWQCRWIRWSWWSRYTQNLRLSTWVAGTFSQWTGTLATRWGRTVCLDLWHWSWIWRVTSSTANSTAPSPSHQQHC